MVWQGRGIISCLALAMYGYGMATLIPYQAQAQSPLPSESGIKSMAEPDTHLVPSLLVAQRYDSNVFFVPGTSLDDYVTTVAPQLKLFHRNQWVEGTVGGGATAEAYVKNPGLNYVAGNGTVDLNLDGAVGRLAQGLGLRVSDTVIYTPQPLAFVAPTGGSQIPPAFVQGIQAQRANSFSNAAKVEAAYRLSEFMSMNVTYVDQRIRFGNPIATPTGASQGGFIDTNSQILTSGFARKLSPADTVFIGHQYQNATFSVPGVLGSQFSTQGALFRWSRLLTLTLKVTAEGGFAIIRPAGSVESLGAASLEWRGQYTTAMVSYSRSVSPSFLFVPTPLLSQIVTATVKRQLSDPLSVSVSGSYAVNESVPDSSLLQFRSYSVTPSINYKISKTFTAALAYTHSQFEQTVASQSFPFDRDQVQLSLVAEWK
jgi:hypothetical protein